MYITINVWLKCPVLRNVARCWTAETAAAVGVDVQNGKMHHHLLDLFLHFIHILHRIPTFLIILYRTAL